MKQEEKELLLKDLCTRLPYHPMIQIYNDSWEGCKKGEFDNMLGFHHVEAFLCDRIEVLPYLRPMSSMTDKEKDEYTETFDITNTEVDDYDIFQVRMVDWLHKHHFDVRGLIEKGLAIEAPEGMYEI